MESTMKKLILIVLLAFFSVSIHSVEEIEKLMVEKAESAQEKKAVYNYMMNESKEKRKLATRLREIAKTRKGGKAATQAKHKKEMMEEADELEKLADEYEKLAKTVKQ
jgi:hypothetical protein